MQTTNPINIFDNWRLAVTKHQQVIRKSKTKVSLVKFAIKFSGKEGWQAVRPQQEKVHPQDQEYE